MRFDGWMATIATLLVACSGGGKSDTGGAETSDTAEAASGPGTMLLSFDLDADLIPTMSEPAAGTFQGSVFAEADASAIGPVAGAVPLVDFESPAMDFGTEGGVLADVVTVGPIDSQVVWILGCFDSDATGCDKGDPITVPNENKFQATPGEASYTIKMTLLNPS
jgi:hypothetical protein